MEGNGKEFRNNMFFKSHPNVLEWLGTSFQQFFLSLNGSERNSECFSLQWNGSERNSEHFYLPWNGSEQIHEVQSVFSLLRNCSERNSEHFYLPQNGLERNSMLFPFRQNSNGMNQNFRLFHVSQNNFFSGKMPTLAHKIGAWWAVKVISECPFLRDEAVSKYKDDLILGIIPMFLLGSNITYWCPKTYFGYAESGLI